MKKTNFLSSILVLLLAVGVQTARAQRPVGDTLTSMDPSYFPYNYNFFASDDTNLRATIFPWLIYYFGCFETMGRPPFYMMDEYNCEIVWNIPNYYYPLGRMITGNQLYTDRPLKILGIAACGFRQRTAYYPLQGNASRHYNYPSGVRLHPEWYIPSAIDTTFTGRVTDSLILYLPTPEGPVMQAAGPWRAENPHRYITLPERYEDEYLYPLLHEWDTVEYSQSWPHEIINWPQIDTFPTVPLYEVMFEKPQIVADSFIVAGTCNNNVPQSVRITEADSMYLWQHNPTRYWYLRSNTNEPDTDNITWIYYSHPYGFSEYCGRWKKFRPTREWGWSLRRINDDSIAVNWYWFTNLMFPIIDPDFDTNLCDEVRGVRVAEATDTSVTLMWNGGNAVRWEVNYVEMGSSDDHTVTVTSPLAVLTGLRPQTDYMVHVRAMCEWDTEYGPWSDIVQFVTSSHHTEPESIDNLDRFTQVLPNPAHGQVSVISSYRLSRVEVYDLQGRALLSHDDEGLSTVLDISSLPSGQYIMVIHTPAGLATKKLTVQ